MAGRPLGRTRRVLSSGAGLCQGQVDRGFAAIPAAFDVERHSLPVVELLNPGAFQREM